MSQLGITGYTIKHINDGNEFMSSFDVPEAKDIRVILNPHIIEGGKVRYTLVTPNAN
jgi:hypothetical protein